MYRYIQIELYRHRYSIYRSSESNVFLLRDLTVHILQDLPQLPKTGTRTAYSFVTSPDQFFMTTIFICFAALPIQAKGLSGFILALVIGRVKSAFRVSDGAHPAKFMTCVVHFR